MKKLMIVLTITLLISSCSLFGTKNPHTEGLIIPPDTTTEDVSG